MVWVWWVALREKQLTIQVAELGEMQITSSKNSSATSLCVAENRTKAGIQGVYASLLKEKKKK